MIAAGFYLDGFGLLLSGNGAFHGAGYADVNARLLTYRILTFLTPLAGVMLAAGIWKGAWRLALLPPVIVFAVYGIGIKVYPALLQKFKVAPNELALETPYIENNIKFTRLGYDLDKIETIPFDVDLKLSAADIANNDATIKNIRLWDHAPLLKTYSQLQQIRTYYKFFDVDNDRYMVNGQYTQVMLSPRELSYADLPSRNWINERLIFTHGNGLTFGPVSRISKEGLPEFFVKDIPAVSLADIKVTRPEIYYGELSNDYVIVKTKVPEFSYPTATGNINTTYAGKGGVPIDSLAQKGPLCRQVQDGKDSALVRHHRREPHPLLPQHQRAGEDDSPLPPFRRRSLHGRGRKRQAQMDHRRLHLFEPSPLFKAAQGGHQLHAEFGKGGCRCL